MGLHFIVPLCYHHYNLLSWLQGCDDKPYEPLAPTQSPINPPYKTACQLKKTNVLETSSHTADLQTITGESRRKGASQDISSVGSLTGTLSGETNKKSLQEQQELPSLVEEEQRQ